MTSLVDRTRGRFVRAMLVPVTVLVLVATAAAPASAVPGDDSDPYLTQMYAIAPGSTAVLDDLANGWGFSSSSLNYAAYANTSSVLLPYSASELTVVFERSNADQDVAWTVDYGCSRPTCTDDLTPNSVSGTSFTVPLRAHDSDAGDDVITIDVDSDDESQSVNYSVTVRRADPSTLSTVTSQTCTYVDYSMQPGQQAQCGSDLTLVGWENVADNSADLVVDNSTTEMTFSVIPVAGATMGYRWNGAGSYTPLSSGASTGLLALTRTGTSLNVLQVRVYAQSYPEDSVSYTDYYVEIERRTYGSDSRPSTISYRASGTSTPGTLVPSFSSTTLNYSGTVGSSSSSFDLLVDLGSGQTATASVNGGAAMGLVDNAYATMSGLSLGNNQVKVTVVGATSSTVYTLLLVRGSASSVPPYLASFSTAAGTISPSFSQTTFAYAVSTLATSTTVSAVAADLDASVTYSVNGGGYQSLGNGGTTSTFALNTGTNNVLVRVTSPVNPVGNVYTLTITRGPTNNANLSALVLSAGPLSPVFSSTTTEYRVAVPQSVTTTTVTATKVDAAGRIEMRKDGGSWITITSGVASGAVSLDLGINRFEVRVTASDNVTQKTYAVRLTRGEKVAIPDVRGLRLSVAKQRLRALGFEVEVRFAYSASVPRWRVMNYWPKLPRYPGKVIVLRVSQGRIA